MTIEFCLYIFREINPLEKIQNLCGCMNHSYETIVAKFIVLPNSTYKVKFFSALLPLEEGLLD